MRLGANTLKQDKIYQNRTYNLVNNTEGRKVRQSGHVTGEFGAYMDYASYVQDKGLMPAGGAISAATALLNRHQALIVKTMTASRMGGLVAVGGGSGLASGLASGMGLGLRSVGGTSGGLGRIG